MGDTLGSGKVYFSVKYTLARLAARGPFGACRGLWPRQHSTLGRISIILWRRVDVNSTGTLLGY